MSRCVEAVRHKVAVGDITTAAGDEVMNVSTTLNDDLRISLVSVLTNKLLRSPVSGKKKGRRTKNTQWKRSHTLYNPFP